MNTIVTSFIIREDRRRGWQTRCRIANTTCLRLLNEATQQVGFGRYSQNLVRNAMLAYQEGKPWKSVRYEKMARVFQLERRLARINNLWLYGGIQRQADMEKE